MLPLGSVTDNSEIPLFS